MTFPVSYDDDNILFGDPADQKTLILSQAGLAYDTELFFESVVGVSAPAFIWMEGELIKVTGVNLDSLDVERDPAIAISHTTGMAGFIVIAAEHLNILRDRALATQKYQGLLGNDADKPASPQPTEVYIAIDTEKVYACIIAGQWSLLGGAKSHADTLIEGATDDHPQYYTDTRLTAWHDSLTGQHVTDGDNHDHRYGGGAGRVKTATVATLPNKGVGYIRLTTDTGELYIGTGATTWLAITGAPSGAIIMLQEADAALYGGACPPGWSRYTALDGKFPKGAPSGVSSPLNSGGASTHYHVYSQVPAHTHSVPQLDATSDSSGNHSHSFAFATLASGTGIGSQGAASAGDPVATSQDGTHTHTFSYPLMTTGSSGGSASANSSTVSSLPPYKEVVFCKKD
jgi:hypothetical protein